MRRVVDWTSGDPVDRPYQVAVVDRDAQLAIARRLDRMLATDSWPDGAPLTPRDREQLRGNLAALTRLLATSSST
jgi:hypothetical protein